MKSYKLNIFDNGRRIGFVYNNIESLNQRYNRALEQASLLNKHQTGLTQKDSPTEYVLNLVVG